jgi:SNF2 family DNA or RNA helicase
MEPVNEVLEHITLPFKLHQYQVDDVNRFAKLRTCGVYWDMGLGKTNCATMLGVYKLLNGFNSCIILCPASLITQWVEWLESLDLAVTDYRGSPKKREKIDFDSDFIVMSPQIFQNDYEKFKGLKDIYYIVDEATNLCSHNNIIFKLLRGGIVKKTQKIKLSHGTIIPITKDYRYEKIMHDCCLLTGTPLSGDPIAAYGLISITSPEAYPNYGNFYRKHVLAEDNFGSPVAFKDLDVLHDNLVENAEIREVSDHLDMPEKVVKVVKYDLSPAHMKLYRKLIQEQLLVLEDGSVIDATEATKLFHMSQQFIFCPLEFKGKVEGLEVLDSLVKATKTRILFNNYIATNELMMERYDAGGCFGSVSRKDKDRYVEEFKAGDLDTITIHPKSGGYGLNLFNCNQVIFPEMPLAPRDYKQCLARSWRQGQTKTVVITILVARKTIQESLLRNTMKRDDVVSKVLHTKETIRKMLEGEL